MYSQCDFQWVEIEKAGLEKAVIQTNSILFQNQAIRMHIHLFQCTIPRS